MQNSEDDMNELFRRASRGYRLNIPGEDWDAIQKRLASNASASISVESNIRNRNNYKWLIIALFVYVISGTTLYPVPNLHREPRRKAGEKVRVINNSIVAANNNIPLFGKVRSGSKIGSPAILTNIPLTDEMKKDLAYFGVQGYKIASNLSKPGEWEIHRSGQVSSAPIQVKNSNKPGESSKKEQGVEKNNHFYIGMVAGPQFNNTKEQEFSKPGLSAGLLAGYRLNGKLAIETGFIISDKKYRSAGGYFDMSKISATMPAGMKVLSVESKSTVLEIPLRIKYDWLKLKRGEVFGTAGLSSYILTKESNRYLGSLNGSREDLSGNYSQSQKYFAAAVNVSAGYQFTTGRGMKLRIEPYVQVPVKKIGVGSLPVLSTGIYLGVTIPLSN